MIPRTLELIVIICDLELLRSPHWKETKGPISNSNNSGGENWKHKLDHQGWVQEVCWTMEKYRSNCELQFFIQVTPWLLGGYCCNSKCVIFKHIFNEWYLDYFQWNCPQADASGLQDEKSTLVQVMAWCYQATSHCMNQCGPTKPLLN